MHTPNTGCASHSLSFRIQAEGERQKDLKFLNFDAKRPLSIVFNELR